MPIPGHYHPHLPQRTVSFQDGSEHSLPHTHTPSATEQPAADDGMVVRGDFGVRRCRINKDRRTDYINICDFLTSTLVSFFFSVLVFTHTHIHTTLRGSTAALILKQQQAITITDTPFHHTRHHNLKRQE
jgi:hypothetical protein